MVEDSDKSLEVFEENDELLVKIRALAEAEGEDSFMNDFWKGQQGIGTGV